MGGGGRERERVEDRGAPGDFFHRLKMVVIGHLYGNKDTEMTLTKCSKLYLNIDIGYRTIELIIDQYTLIT